MVTFTIEWIDVSVMSCINELLVKKSQCRRMSDVAVKNMNIHLLLDYLYANCRQVLTPPYTVLLFLWIAISCWLFLSIEWLTTVVKAQ